MGGHRWPLANADPVLVSAAGILFLFAYAFKAWGWQRLFTEDERPEALTLAAAGDRKSTRLNSSHSLTSRMPSSA